MSAKGEWIQVSYRTNGPLVCQLRDCGWVSLLHGPTMFAVKAKIYGVLYNQSSSIAFDETSSYWSVPKSS